VGAGPAGLASAAELGRRGIHALVVGRASAVAAAWPDPPEISGIKLVTDSTLSRSTSVNGAVAERMPAVAGSDVETFESLYRRAFPRVYAYVAALLRDRAAAEDVTAQAFERAYRKRRSYRSRRGTPEAWLFGIARNAALDELRRRKRSAGFEADTEDLGAAALDEQAELARRRLLVRTALVSLDGHERDLIALKFAGGLSNAEIGRILGMSESNAGTRLHRTMTKLRKACHE
jgi:RNA polymerase sigma-70 factor, ECF subfamily